MLVKLSKNKRMINTNFLNKKKSTSLKVVEKRLPNGRKIKGKVKADQKIVVGKNPRNLKFIKTPKEIIIENALKKGKFNTKAFNALNVKGMNNLLNNLGVTNKNFKTTFLTKIIEAQNQLNAYKGNKWVNVNTNLVISEVSFFKMCDTLNIPLSETLEHYNAYSKNIKNANHTGFDHLMKRLQKGGIKEPFKKYPSLAQELYSYAKKHHIPESAFHIFSALAGSEARTSFNNLKRKNPLIKVLPEKEAKRIIQNTFEVLEKNNFVGKDTLKTKYWDHVRESHLYNFTRYPHLFK